MNKLIFSALLLSSITTMASAEILEVATPSTQMLLEASQGQPLKFVYYGAKLTEQDKESLLASNPRKYTAYPVYGMKAEQESAMSVTHSDGNMTLEPVVRKVTTITQEDGAQVITVSMTDTYYPFDIDVKYRTYPQNDVIETWVEATNRQKGPVQLREFASGYLPVHNGNVWLTQFYGSWGNESRMAEAPLEHGMKVIKNKDGVRNAQTSRGEIMLSLDGQPRENTGRVIGAAICYSGNYQISIDTDNSEVHRLFAGINEDNSTYTLEKGETFVTPPLALTWSDEGKSGVSRNFHRWGRTHRLAHGESSNKVLLNSWEGVYMNIDEERMASMMADIASMGGELFVMDDGWFGDKYPRNYDDSSLGDWVVNTRKLPHGIQGLIDTAHANGIEFGIWIEPEMANTVSELYDNHPDYVVKASNRDLVQGRGGTQVVLDMSNPKVQELVFTIVDTLMTKYPELDYIKWDANAPIMNHGSQYLPKDKQSHLYIEYHKGLEKTLQRIRAKYPDLTIQACASGGGRANWGILPYFDEFWVSDNTDALQRIYMQWGTSHFFPAVAMASHISASPNHQTQRSIPLKYRIDVAMSGRLGMELQPKDMTDAEKELCRNAIAEYKQVRDVIQLGDIYRLISPYDRQGVASLMYVNPDKDDVVLFWWKTESFVNQQIPRVTLSGLDPKASYTITELNRIDRNPLPIEGKTFSGDFLMKHGLEMPSGHNAPRELHGEYASRVLRLTKN